RPGEHADAQRRTRGRDLPLDAPFEQRVLDLRGDRRGPPRPRLLPGRGAGGLPAGEVRYPDITGFSALYGGIEGTERLLEGRVRVVPVDLPQIDIIGAQPLERRVEGPQQVGAGAVAAAVHAR